jgi:hypothetical protein
MSKSEVVKNTGNMMVINRDTSKVFIWNPDSIYANYNNSTYDPIELKAGTIMGRVAYTQHVKECKSSANDGSQFPIGVLMQDVTVDDGDIREVAVCVGGEVAEEKLIYQITDGPGTAVSGRSLRDHLQLAGIKLVSCDEHTRYDNQ